jgi:hypothetical protein
MRRGLTIVGGVVFVLVVGGGAFYGGIVFERSRESDVQDRFFAERGGFAGDFGDIGHDEPSEFQQSGDHDDDQGAFQGRGSFDRGASGTVKSIEGDTLLLSTPQDVATVILTDETVINLFVDGELEDLTTEQRVTVVGRRNEAGDIVADVIQILSEQ